ncbi:MAG: minichromosome maintenance protein MCM [Zestosphaera sp.]
MSESNRVSSIDLREIADERKVDVGLIKSFLSNFRGGDGSFKYKDRIRRMIREGGRSLPIDYEDLAAYDVNLVEFVEESPDEAFDAFSSAMKEIIRGEYPEHAVRYERFHARLSGWVRATAIRSVASENLGKLIAVDGVIVKATPRKSKLYKALFIHVLPTGDEHEFWWPPGEKEELKEDVERPPYCPICVNELVEEERIRYRGTIKLEPERSKYRDWQLVVVQERPEEIPAGQIPRSIEVVLTDDLVDAARPGDRVTVVGVVRLARSSRFNRIIYTPYIEANNVIVAQRLLEELRLSAEDEAKILEIARDPMIRRKIIASIAPTIYGMWDVKEAIALALFGGNPKVTRDGTRLRGDIHVLMVGDPGTAKSQLLQYAARIAPRGIYTTGKGSSAAGLTAAVVKDKQTGEYFLEAGAMVLADGGIVGIDEIDKMRDEDRVAIHEAMEQGSVSIAKAGIVARLNARTTVIAAGNPKRGRYVSSESVAENIDLPITILSRFDLIFIVKDLPDLTKDTSLSSYVLKTHEKAGYVESELQPDLLRKYIAYARRYVRPELTEEAEKIIQEYYIELRKKSAEKEDAPLAITTRQLEALVRLAEAHAKMKLKNKVEAEDAVEAVRLMNSVLEHVGMDVETGAIDIDLIMTGKPKSMREKEVTVVKLIRDILTSGEECVKYKDLRKKISDYGIDEESLEKILRNLRRNGEIFEPKASCYAITD